MGCLRGTKTQSTRCEPGRRGGEAGGSGLRMQGTRVCPRPTHADVRQKPSHCCEVASLKLKTEIKNQREALRAREHYFSRTDTQKQD